MSSNEGTRRWRRLGAGALAGVLLLAGAIALGVVYSNKGPQAAPATAPATAAAPVGDSDVSKVLDALTNLAGKDEAALSAPPAEAIVPASVVPVSNEDKAAAPAAGGAPVPGTQGVIQSVSAAVAQQLGMHVCTPKDGKELYTMVTGSSCNVILLTKSNADSDHYVTEGIMHVTSSKIIIGHPIDIPVIKVKKGVERMFEVHPGAVLDMRFVMMIRPGGRSLDEGRLRLIVGGMAFVRLGGTYRASGCVFTDPPQTWEGFYNEITHITNRKRTFGGYVLVLGGDFFCYGCQVVRNYPYGVPIINVFQIGRDFLVVAGLSVCVGVYHAAWVPYISTVNVGNGVAVLGGASIRIGGGLLTAGYVTGQWGAGQGIFVGGGVLVDVGHQIQNCFTALARASFGMSSVGAGVGIFIAELENRAWGAALMSGAGQVYSVGAGILDKTGGEVVNCQVSVIQAIVGGSAYLGAGSMSIVGEQFARVGVTLAQYGAGMTWFNGAGSMDLIYVPSFVTQVARIQGSVGAEVFLGSGWYNNVNNTRWSYQVVNAAMPGYEGWVGLGGAVFIRSRTYSKRVINYRVRPYLWVVSGQGVAGGVYSNNNLLVTKDGTTILKPQPMKAPHGSKARMLQDLSVQAAAKARKLPFGEASLTAVQCVADTRKVRPPSADHLRRRLDAARADVHKSRRLQGMSSTSGLSLLGGVNAAALMEAWEGATQDSAKDVVVGEDGVERWPEYVFAGGNNTKCFLCGLSPGLTASHVNPNAAAELPIPLLEGEVVPNACATSDECAEGVAGSQDAFSLLRTAERAAPEPISFPKDVKTWAKSRYAKRLLRILQENSDGTGHATALPDHNIMTYEVTAYCPGAVACSLQQGDIKAAFEKYIDATIGPESAYKLTAAAGDVPSAVSKVLGENDGEAFGAFAAAIGAKESAKGCGKGIKFSLYATAPDDESAREVLAILDGVAKDPDAVMQELQAGAGTELCDLDVEKKGSMLFPAANKAGAQAYYQQMYTGLGRFSAPSFFPDVTVVAENQVAPVEAAVAGRNYRILLENFTGMGDVIVQLVQGTSGAGETVATVEGGMKKGQVLTVDFTAPEPIASEGSDETRAYIRAFYVNVPGLFAQSEVFTLEPAW